MSLRYFNITERGSNVRREVLAGLTTFLSMAYILIVNPSILTAGFEIALSAATHTSVSVVEATYAGLIFNVKLSFTVATALAAAIATLIMGLYANMPFGLAPGMGENSFIAFSVIPLFTEILVNRGHVVGVNAALLGVYLALISVLFNGILFLVFSIGKLREAIINSIPERLRLGIAIGIGLFIAFIGFSSAGIVTAGIPGATPVQLNTKAFSQLPLYLALVGFILAATLYALRVTGSFLISIVVISIVGAALGYIRPEAFLITKMPLTTSIINGIPNSFYLYFSLFGLGFPIAFSLFIVDFFDGIGTITGLSIKANLVKDGRIVNINRALVSDSLASIIAPFIGTSTTVVYIESSTGIESGGRTGLTALTTALMLLVSIPFAPLIASIPSFATAGVLIMVGLLFLSMASDLKLSDDLSEVIPAFLAIISIPFTYSITTGIGLAILTYVALKILMGKYREVTWGMWLVAALFIVYFTLVATIGV
ncbi:NCS2 family permease [Caldivirga maquilingensis]|uniref:Xanthine/uracil/vitamin C permease n=1 Tax=Caldivirga maquilingensis (strain ATCC 700844 / DSM 13496 / JCM 10307 / IC-167) TaxID=397948 RepID=A8MD46_CALMQ|nr:NCS2 family permease [Caldivirga maquilingensis]ABW01702.1 Xanthine/uracil/vitamin C permease [Caldivirga maquilingensis IC-167]